MRVAEPLAIDLFCGLAYLVTCVPSGKQYVGITARSLMRRWYEHTLDAEKRPGQSAIRRAIAKYGKEQFTIEPLCCARNYADLLSVEKDLIKQCGTRAPGGYNLTDGGQGANGCTRSLEHRAAIVRALTGKPRSAITRAKVSASKMGISQNVGAANPGAKLTESQVREARARLAAGASQNSIAISFGIHRNAIWKIANGLKWKSVA